MTNNSDVVKRLKDLREFSDLSRKECASLCGMAELEYGEYEDGKKDLSIGVLYNIAAAFKIDPTLLLTGEESKNSEAVVVEGGKGVEIERYVGYSFSSLASDFIDRKMEPMIVTISNTIKPELVMHTGQEFNYVLEGELRVIVGMKEHYLRKGDSIYFNPSQPHAQLAMSETARFLTVILEK